MDFTANLRESYRTLFRTMEVRPNKVLEVKWVLDRVNRNRRRYEVVAGAVEVPWRLIAAIHTMEAGLRFDCHLHNGDPLTDRTVQVPRGRPLAEPTGIDGMGRLRFTWEESAMDALVYKKLNRWIDWSIEGMLYKLEEYNGWGYRKYHPSVLTPYLWAGSNHYEKGKYVSDGSWDANAISRQVGAAVILRQLGV